jgi:hypothetical protein
MMSFGWLLIPEGFTIYNPLFSGGIEQDMIIITPKG